MERDGRSQGARTRFPVLGAVVLATDLTTERDIRALVPAEAAFCAARVPFENPTTPERLRAVLPHLAEAAALIAPGEPLAALYFACTSAGAVLGAGPVEAALAAARPGVPVVTPLGAAQAAFAALGVRRVAVLTPYLPQTAAVVVDDLAARGLEIVATLAMGHADDRDMARLPADAILAAARTAMAPEAEALFVSCTALPAATLVPRIEAALGRPVVTSNLAGLWACLGHAGLAPPAGRGRLLDRTRAAA
jgi:maleate isomerase